MIYVLEPEIFDHFPDAEEVDFALDVFPALLERDVPFGVHVTDDYWNDVGSLPEYLQGNFDVLTGAVAGRARRRARRLGRRGRARRRRRALRAGAARRGRADRRRRAARRAAGDRAGAQIGAGARVRESVLLPGAEVPADGLLAGAIAGSARALAGIAAGPAEAVGTGGRWQPRTRASFMFRELLDAAPDPIVIVNEAGAIVHVNARLEEMLGYQRAELLGERVEILIPERFAVSHRVHRGDYVAAPTVRPMGSGLELWARHKDGSEIPVEISLAPLETADRDPGLGGTARRQRPPAGGAEEPRARGDPRQRRRRRDRLVARRPGDDLESRRRADLRLRRRRDDRPAPRRPRPAGQPERAARASCGRFARAAGSTTSRPSGCARTATMIDVSLSAAPDPRRRRRGRRRLDQRP